MFDATVVPGAAVLELALHAAAELDASNVASLALDGPWTLDPQRPQVLQLTVAPPEEGARPFLVRSRPRDAAEEEPWTTHAHGILGEADAADTADETGEAPEQWPPAGAEAAAAETAERAAERGLDIGPALQGTHGAWHRGDTWFVEAELPEEAAGAGDRGDAASRFKLHPALAESVLQTVAAHAADTGAPLLPAEWSGVHLHAVGATAVRARIARVGDTEFRIELFDPTGAPVATIARCAFRPVTADELRRASSSPASSLYRVEARPVEARPEPGADAQPAVVLPATEPFDGAPTNGTDPEEGGDAPSTVVVRFPGFDATPGGVREATRHGLALLQRRIAAHGREGDRVVWATRNAIAADGDDHPPNPAMAALWGLGRSFQAEHPELPLVLLDTDIDPDDAALAELAQRVPDGENQVVVREGAFAALRLLLADTSAADRPAPWSPHGTVLVTGGTGGLARATSRHLVARHGVRHLLLLSRSGPEAAGADALVRELEEAGAETVTLGACDVSDREELGGAIAAVPPERPLTAVVHTAGVLDDALIGDLTPERVDMVLRAKVDGALHLHELTKDADLSAFVLYSSAAGTIGGPAQANYAAANAALDALAQRRARMGLPAVSLAWGVWSEAGLATELHDQHRRRLLGTGLLPIDHKTGMALFDASLSGPDPAVAPAPFDRALLQQRATARPETVPAMLRSLVRRPLRRAADAGGTGSRLADRLLRLPEAERAPALLDAVRGELAAVLGLAGPAAVPADRPVGELGLDSLMAVESRNRLSALVGEKLPANLLFDHPTPQHLADALGDKLGSGIAAREPSASDAEEARIRDLLATVPIARLRESGLLTALLEVAEGGADGAGAAADTADDGGIDTMDVDDLLRLAEEGEHG